MELILAAGGSVLGVSIVIIGYFLKRTMESVDGAIKRCEENSIDIAVLTKDHENKHDALNKQMGELTSAIKDNTKELKEFRQFVYEKLAQ